MNGVDRRSALRNLGTFGLGTVLGGGAPAVTRADQPEEEGAGWTYPIMDAPAAADRAYDLYPGNGCMYAVFRSIVGHLADTVGRPFTSFPFHMLAYGHGGAGGYGTLCGALNAAAAVIGLFETRQRARDLLITEVFKWYETAELPAHRPARGSPAAVVPTSVAGSILCHASIAGWCRVASASPYDKLRGERCRRLSADVAARTVTVLNRSTTEGPRELTVDDASAACMRCHASPTEPRVTVRTLMNCGSCHTVTEPHPAPPR
ncbi:MAG: C_GCAxxG_C_C family protein [Verrucomicrobiales bacterium]|nr:C_GCAxxG_C_C family protein [Verrucomicrobiales bacterium]MCP5527053.1 C_GCAxxG_C_C family protein [Verrucomicrobiales bacterium]